MLIFVTTVGLIISTLLVPIAWVVKRASRIRDWLDEKLKWNWIISLLMEGLADLAFGTVITIMYVDVD